MAWTDYVSKISLEWLSSLPGVGAVAETFGQAGQALSDLTAFGVSEAMVSEARDEGGTPRCVYELPRDVYRALHPLRVAHRTLPCGTLLVVEAGRRRTLAAVLDRGPWNRVQVARPGDPPPGAYRGDLDVSPRPADALGLTLRVGRLRVRYWRAAWQPFAVRRPPNS